jgi:hypothetical protein
MRVFRWVALGVLLAGVVPAAGQVASGPKVGEKAAPLKVFAVTGPQENKELDYTVERKDKPTVFLFVKADKFDRPMARFIRALDMTVTKLSDDGYIVAVWLTEDKDKTKEHLPRIQQSVQFQNTALTYFPGEVSGPQDWSINTDAHLTAVIVHQGKVAATFGYQSLNETDVPEVEKAIKKAVGKE